MIRCILSFALLVNCGNTIQGQDPTAQVTGLRAFHRSGQTFLVWEGIEEFGEHSTNGNVSGGLLQTEYKQKLRALEQAEKNGRKIRYRVYRSEKPIINAGSLKYAKLLAEVKPLSIYYPYHLGMYWHTEKFQNNFIPRLAVEPQKPLLDGQELYVHNVQKPGKYYYAVLSVIKGSENYAISPSNSLAGPMYEKPGEPEPVLQKIHNVGMEQLYLYQKGLAEIRYYMRWVEKPYSNFPQCFEWTVAIPEDYHNSKPAALQVALHEWGGHIDSGTYWYEVQPSTIRIATVNCPVQDWWYGYRNSLSISNPGKDDIVFNYTEQRLLSFIKWLQKNWHIDQNLVFVEGQSMGGSGAMSLGMKNGDLFSYIDSWVGISSWRHSTYFRNGERGKWGEINELLNYNGIRFDDWMDLSWWLRKYPRQETPFLSFGNGKNDGTIGWTQAVFTVQALRETKRPFVFVWGMSGHGQRSRFMMDSKLMALNQSIPAFRNCSLDDILGTAKRLQQPKKHKMKDGTVIEDRYDGDSGGQINAYLRWQNITDLKGNYQILVYLTSDAPKGACSVDMTPRRMQKFKARPAEKFMWKNISVKNNREIQSGESIADRWGFVTVEKLLVTKGGNRIEITRAR